MSVRAPARAGSAARPAPGSARARQTRRRLAVVGLVLALAVGFLLYKTLTAAVVYFKTTSEALAARAALGNSTFQLEGVVVPHSIVHLGAAVERFSVATGRDRIEVENEGSPPSLFQADIPVVLVGHFVGSSNRFASDEILVKHSNVYIAAHPNRVRAPNGSVR